MRRPLHFVRLLLAASFLSSVALADPAAEARFHDEAARKFYERGDFEHALREFFLEQRAAPNARIAFNIALCFQDLKRNEDAYHYFREYLRSTDPDVERRKLATDAVKELEAKVARVLVETSVPGADVYVDQREFGSYGATPRVIAVPAGEHQLWVDLPGYRPVAAKVTALRGQEVRVRLSPERIVGQLAVDSLVAGNVRVSSGDGETVAQGASPLHASIPPGTYQLTLTAPGYLPWSGVTSVVADRTVSATAAPQRAPFANGEITVTSNIPGALVELDGEPAGFTPTVLSGVAVGKHQLTATSQGVLSWSGAVAVAADKRSWVTVSLERPATVRRSSATWLAGGVGGLSLVSAGVFGVLAANAHSDFKAADPGSDRSALRDRGVALNTATDVMVVTGLVALGAAVVLYFTTSEERGRDSSASVTTSTR